MEFSHKPVLLKETLEGLKIKNNGVYLDGTLGGAGHSREILKRLSAGLLIGIDQDERAIEASEKVLRAVGDNFKLFHLNYKDFKAALQICEVSGLDGILLDLGVSSHQFDDGERGFSYNYNSKLDMRMNKKSKLSAYEIVNNYSEDKLTRVLYENAEEKWAARIAKFIDEQRKIHPIESTFELVDIIKKAIPRSARQKKGHPAKKTFQALRIETNNELEVLKNSLSAMIDCLNPGGRIAIITFHSLEDRIVKEIFKYHYTDCICPKEFPVCQCDKRREIEIITRKPIVAQKSELIDNNRAHSAKLRIAEKLG